MIKKEELMIGVPKNKKFNITLKIKNKQSRPMITIGTRPGLIHKDRIEIEVGGIMNTFLLKTAKHELPLYACSVPSW